MDGKRFTAPSGAAVRTSSARSIVWRIDTASLQLQFISRDAEDLLGVPVDRFYEPGFWPNVLHPQDRERTLDLMVRAAAGEPVPDFEYRVLTIDGRTLWLRTVARLTGVPGELLGVSFDETAQRRTNALLAGDLKILQMVAAGVPLPEILDALVTLIEELGEDMIGSILALEEGIRVRHLAGRKLPASFIKAIDGRTIGPEEGSCGTAAHRRETVIVEDIQTDPLWARYRGVAQEAGLRACWSVPIQAHDKSVLGTFALYFGTPRRPSPELLDLARHAANLAAVAMERHRREAALRVSEERLSLVYRHVDDVLFHLQVEPGGDYRFASVNPAFCRSTGVEASRIIGKSVREVIPEPSLSKVLQHYDQAIRTNRTVRWEETTRYPTGDRYGDVAITPVFDDEGRPKFLVGSVHDLTERKRLEEDNRQLQKLEAIGRLTGGVAHDFNNLLTVILGYGELLLAQPAGPDFPRTELQEIVAAGHRASSLTRQLLAFARKQTLQPQRIDLNVLIRSLEKMLRRLIRENIAISMALSPDLGPVLADPGQIEQVIVNLAVNARDAIAEAGRLSFETANVDLDEDHVRRHPGAVAGPHVRLSLTDTGCGMDEETRKRIFEPFFTTKEKGRGTGLGLATVYGIVNQSGGHLEVISEPGRGTTFSIFLPRAGDHAEETKSRVRPSTLLAGGEKVLVVEDELALRTLCERMLKGLKYQVTVAEHGEAALAAVEQKGLVPDLLLTDVVMPGMSGQDLVERLRRSHPALKVVYMSGYTDKAIDEQSLSGTGTAFLQKPFTVAALTTALRKALEAT